MKVGWNFPLNNEGRIHGINESGIETFHGAPNSSLAREVIQNSLDAGQDNSLPVKVKFSLHKIKRREFPNRKEFKKILKSCLEFWSGEVEKTEEFFENALRIINSKEVKVLKVSDFNTSGLTGAREDTINNWYNLVKGSGVSSKHTGAGGSFGIGKQAIFAHSNLRTVFFGTKDREGVKAFQGVAELVTHSDSKGKKTQGTGFYGIKDENKPILNLKELNNIFHREKVGTDIYIFGYKYLENWETSIIRSVLENYFAAIYYNELEVRVEDTTINSKTINDLIDKYISEEDSSDYYVDKYFDALTSDESYKFIEEDFEGLGTLELYIISKQDYPKRVAMVRGTGMKIFDKGHIRTTMKFAGVLIAKGDNLNEFLRKLEPPSHDDWEPNRHPDIKYAKKIRRNLYSWINDKIGSISINEKAEKLDVEGMSQFLPDEVEEISLGEESTDEEKEGLPDISEQPKIKKVETKKTEVEVVSGSEGLPKSGGELGAVSGNGKEGSGSGSGRYDEEEVDPNESGSGRISDNGEKRLTSERPIKLEKSRIFCINPEKGIYHVTVSPNKDGKGYLKFNIAGENISDPARVKLAKLQNNLVDDGNESLNIKANGKAVGPIKFREGEEIMLVMHLKNSMRCALEVSAYED